MVTFTDEDLTLIGAAKDGDYLTAYKKRRENGAATAHDVANAAYSSALVSHGRVTGDTETVPRETVVKATAHLKRARNAAALAVKFLAQDRDAAAWRCAQFAEMQADEIRSLSPDKFDADPGIVPVFEDGRKGALNNN